jgi:hypothetical protein
MEQKNVISNSEEVSINFIGFNIIVLFVFIIWWFNVISSFGFGNYFLSGEKIMFEIFMYTVGSFVLPLLYTIYIMAHINYSKIKRKSFYFKLMGVSWLPTLIFFTLMIFNLAIKDNRVYFE